MRAAPADDAPLANAPPAAGPVPAPPACGHTRFAWRTAMTDDRDAADPCGVGATTAATQVTATTNATTGTAASRGSSLMRAPPRQGTARPDRQGRCVQDALAAAVRRPGLRPGSRRAARPAGPRV